MGIKNLTKLLKKEAPLSILDSSLTDFTGKSVAIDVSSYLYQYAYNKEVKGKGIHLRGFFEMIVNFREHQITPIFIFDGKASEAKSVTLQERKDIALKRNESINESKHEIVKLLSGADGDQEKVPESLVNFDLESYLLERNQELTAEQAAKLLKHQGNISKQEKNNIKITPQMYRDLVTLFKLSGVPYFRAKGEADFLCVKLVKDGIASAVFSEDGDIITHGAKLLVRGINSNDFRIRKELRGYSLERALHGLNLTHQQFIDVCILCGCDYCTSPAKVGHVTALKMIRKYGSIAKFVAACNAGSERYKIDPTTFTYQQAHKEFQKSNLEDVPNINDLQQKPHQDNLDFFLLNNTNYTAKTLAKKLAILKTANGKLKAACEPLKLYINSQESLTKRKLKIKLKTPVTK